jgi:hypothetical protein
MPDALTLFAKLKFILEKQLGCNLKFSKNARQPNDKHFSGCAKP